MATVSADGKITKEILKCRSGEFDLESIHTISLQCLDITDLGCIGECTGIERLDLSMNDISKLHTLAGLVNLSYLNLSANRITSLEGLQSLDNLESLNLSGNLIGSLDALRSLGGLEKLRELRLSDSIQGLTNPVCMNNSYKCDVRKILPKLIILDGERLIGKGSDLFQLCDMLDEKFKSINPSRGTANGELYEEGPWVSPDFWKPSETFEQTNLADAEKQLEALLAECKRINIQADNKLQTFMTSSDDPASS